MANVPESEWEWFGNAGHFICGSRCQFHMTTLVGKFLVSSVGQMASFRDNEKFDTVGVGRMFETMVFFAGDRCKAEGCSCNLPGLADCRELETLAANEAGHATDNHMAMCRKWAALQDYERPKED